MKKSILCIAFLLLTTAFNSYSMESKKPKFTKTIRNILLGRAPLNTLWQKSQITIDPFPFTDLPKDIQNEIIYFLSLNIRAQSLTDAAFTINSLALVNKELNVLINNPKFCLNIIKYLAMKFNCSDQTACTALNTKAAKDRFNLQMELFNLCSGLSKNVASLNTLIDNGIDLEFTYDDILSLKSFQTPLMLASVVESSILQQLCNLAHQNLLNINKQNQQGETALMIAIHSGPITNVEILLSAGADPEITDNNHHSALSIAKLIGDPHLIHLIENAINKKHEKK